MNNRRFFLQTIYITLSTLLVVSAVTATDVPQNLGNGLGKLVESRVLLNKAKASHTSITTFRGFATEQAASYDSIAIKDSKNPEKYLVDIHPNGRMSFEELKADLTSRFPSLQITSIDDKYRGVGVIEGYISLDDVAELSSHKSVTSVQLGIKPYLKKAKTPAAKAPVTKTPGATNIIDQVNALTTIGTCFDQGVTQHRVDKISQVFDASAPTNWDGSGMSVGCISDSYDTRTAAPHAAQDIANFDLPGAGGNPYNTTPVFILKDEAPNSSTDECRALAQIIYKMAPRAKLGVSTANGGEVSFANCIRGLAGINSADFPNASTQGFKAQTICDDVGYFDEPWFQDGIIGAGVEDAAAQGVSHFSSASNDIGTNGYASLLRWVPNGTGNTAAAGNTALAGTNIDLTGVPADLIAGGFHNFNPNPGQLDVAQTWAIAGGTNPPSFVMQWDDPYDQNTAPPLDGPAIYTNTGNVTTSAGVTFTNIPALTAGELYELRAFKTGSSTVDCIVTVRDPSNNAFINNRDTTIDETVRFYAPVTGSGYQIIITPFSGTGTVEVDLFHAFAYTGTTITSNLNLLAFRIDNGAYVSTSSLKENNFATNQPIELGQVFRPTSPAQTGVQLVVSRSNVPAGRGPTHLRIQNGGNGLGGIGPVEYFTYNAVATGGHDTSPSNNGVAAYSVFRPSRPETFTSPGPVVYYFDTMSNRLTNPDVRLQPRLAAADQANTSFFSGESTADGDLSPNFSGTSASAPHACVISAILLQSKGGPGSLTPAQITNILTRSCFNHDLDPMFASGSATATNGGTVSITVNSDSSNISPPAGTNPLITSGLGLQDNNSWKVSYSGPGWIQSLTFNPAGTAATGGNTTGGNNGLYGQGVNHTTAPFDTYFSNVYPGCIFTPATKAFTLGTLTGLTAADVTAPQSTSPFTGFSNLAPAPSNGTSHFWTMTVGFPNSNFTTGKAIQFTVGRGQQHSNVVGTFTSPSGGNPFAGPSSGGSTTEATADLLGGAVLIPEGTVFPTGMAFSGTISDGTNTFPFNGTINNALGSGYAALDGYGFINAQAAVTAAINGPSAVPLISVNSRKSHTGPGNLDKPLVPVAPSPIFIESRSGGANGDFTMVFKFANPLTSVGGAILVDGYGSIVSSNISGNEYIVNLTGVTNAQRISVAVIDVADNAGNKSASIVSTMGILLGDSTGDGQVNAADIGQIKARSGATVDVSTSLSDLNEDGAINAADIGQAKARSGSALP